MRLLIASLIATAGLLVQATTGAKAMFYDPGDLGASPLTSTPQGLRAINFARPFHHCGLHYWLETETGVRLTEDKARPMPGRFTVHLRNNIGSGFLTVFDVSGAGKELTPRLKDKMGTPMSSGYLMSDDVYAVPGAFEFSRADSASHLIIIWARSQTEQSQSAADAPENLQRMSSWVRQGQPQIIRETDQSTPGQIGTYVMNRYDGGVAAEIDFRIK